MAKYPDHLHVPVPSASQERGFIDFGQEIDKILSILDISNEQVAQEQLSAINLVLRLIHFDAHAVGWSEGYTEGIIDE